MTYRKPVPKRLAITEGWVGDRDVIIYDVRDAESGMRSRKASEDMAWNISFSLYSLVLVDLKMNLTRTKVPESF